MSCPGSPGRFLLIFLFNLFKQPLGNPSYSGECKRLHRLLLRTLSIRRLNTQLYTPLCTPISTHIPYFFFFFSSFLGGAFLLEEKAGRRPTGQR